MYEEILTTCKKHNAQLIAVSKTKPFEDIKHFYDKGQRAFGENRVQELVDKHQACPKDIEWHMIGTLQTNKVKYIAPFIHLIHSVDRLSLLKEINKQGQKIDRVIPILLQLKIAEEDSKNGAEEADLLQMISLIAEGKFPYTQVKGLMGMATFTDDLTKIRSEFNHLRSFFNQLSLDNKSWEIDILSMGMSGDYKIALEAGSTMIRVGSLLFGSRN